jgi:hypothetical protein
MATEYQVIRRACTVDFIIRSVQALRVDHISVATRRFVRVQLRRTKVARWPGSKVGADC